VIRRYVSRRRKEVGVRDVSAHCTEIRKTREPCAHVQRKQAWSKTTTSPANMTPKMQHSSQNSPALERASRQSQNNPFTLGRSKKYAIVNVMSDMRDALRRKSTMLPVNESQPRQRDYRSSPVFALESRHAQQQRARVPGEWTHQSKPKWRGRTR